MNKIKKKTGKVLGYEAFLCAFTIALQSNFEASQGPKDDSIVMLTTEIWKHYLNNPELFKKIIQKMYFRHSYPFTIHLIIY